MPAQIHINSNVKLITEFNFGNSHDDSRWVFWSSKNKNAGNGREREREKVYECGKDERKYFTFCMNKNFHLMVFHVILRFVFSCSFCFYFVTFNVATKQAYMVGPTEKCK